MMGLRIWTLLLILGCVLPHDESKNLDSINTTLPDFSSLNQTSGGEPLTASLSQTGGKLNSSPTVNVYGTLVTSTTRLPVMSTEDFFVSPTPTEDKSALSMAAVGVTSIIVILVVVVIILVSVVSLNFRCRHCKQDKQKPQPLAVSYSCPEAADPAADKSVTLVSMKNFNTNNSQGIMKMTATCEEQ